MNRLLTCITSLALLVILSGCATTSTLTMSQNKSAINASVVSPKLNIMKISKIMVIPPSGTARGNFDAQIVAFEREFLKRGITVISGAITGKVVLESPNSADEKKNESAALLSDLERALIMAKRTGAEAILQIGTFGWTDKPQATRFFIVSIAGQPFREVTQQEYARFAGFKVCYAAQKLDFTGRFVDVDNGEVIATLNISMPWNYRLPIDYIAYFDAKPLTGWERMPRAESFDYSQPKYYYENGVRHERLETTWQEDAQRLVPYSVIEDAVQTLFPSRSQD